MHIYDQIAILLLFLFFIKFNTKNYKFFTRKIIEILEETNTQFVKKREVRMFKKLATESR